MIKDTLIAPSILSADFSRLGEEIERMKNAGADMLHLDIMDGHFVNNISFGPCIVESARKSTDMFLDVHLMIETPLKYLDSFAKAGADGITFHIESQGDPKEIIKEIKNIGLSPAVALSPNTPLNKITPFTDDVDMVLIMTVVPGFGGQEFIKEMTVKIKELSKIYDKNIQVDGGINSKTAKIAKAAGANILVAGSYLFKSKDTKKAITSLKGVQ